MQGSAQNVIGVVGGSGLYALEGLTHVQEVALDTPFGRPSDVYVTGELNGTRMVFLPRHGRGHRFTPSELNYRANIYGFKQLGVTHLISVSAVGSMKEEIHPGDIVVVDQFIDRTVQRPHTFFNEGIVAHVPLADPVCPCWPRPSPPPASSSACAIIAAERISVSKARSSPPVPNPSCTGAGASR